MKICLTRFLYAGFYCMRPRPLFGSIVLNFLLFLTSRPPASTLHDLTSPRVPTVPNTEL